MDTFEFDSSVNVKIVYYGFTPSSRYCRTKRLIFQNKQDSDFTEFLLRFNHRVTFPLIREFNMRTVCQNGLF